MIVGAGFAGYNAARELSRVAGASTEITVINSTDYFLYLPLLPQVAAGLVEPRHICASLLSRIPKVRFVLGTVTHIDVQQKVVTWSSQSVATALDSSWVQLSTGEKVATHSLIWCVGVRADPLVTGLDLDTNRGQLVVDEFMSVPGAPDIYACGDCAAVPDLTRPGEICGMTAQHAQRQGKQVARNVAASLGAGKARPYKHHDLGFVVDLGGLAAAANPLNIPLSGPLANAVTRAYHLIALAGNRARVLADWGLNVILPAEVTSFGVISPGSVPLNPDQPRSPA